MTALASSRGKQFAASGRRRNFLPQRLHRRRRRPHTFEQRWRAARVDTHHGRSHPGRSAWPGDGAGEVEKASRPPQSGVVCDRVKLRRPIDHWLIVIGTDNDNQS